MNLKKENLSECVSKLSELLSVDAKLPAVYAENTPIQLLMIGQPSQNLFGIIHELTGELPQFDRMMLRGYDCTIRYSDVNEYVVIKGEDQLRVAPEEIANLLSEFSSSPTPLECGFGINNPLFKNVNFRIVASAEEFEDINWNYLLEQSDYSLFVLSSIMLLSMYERRILCQMIMPYMGENLGILLTQDNLIPEEDRSDIQASIDSFFGAKYSVYRLPNTDKDALLTKLNELIASVHDLRIMRWERNVAKIIKNLSDTAERQISVLTAGNNQIEEAIMLTNEKVEAIPARKEAACRYVRMQYLSKFRLEVGESLSEFNQTLVEKLRDEINNSDDTSDLPNTLPNYIQDQWNKKIEEIKGQFESAISDIEADLGEFIKNDLKNFLQEGAGADLSNYIFTVIDMYADPIIDKKAFNYTEVKNTSKLKTAGAIASGVALFLMAHPIIGVSVAVVGSRHFIKEGNKKFIADNKQALIEAVEQMSRSILDDAIVSITKIFVELENSINDKIGDCYQSMIEMVIQALNRKKEDHTSYEEKITLLSNAKHDCEQLLALE